MNNFFVNLVVFCLAPVFISCGSGVSEKKSAGQVLYEANCANCHGTDGKLCALGAKDLSLSTMTKEQAAEIIANGKSTMTPFKFLLTSEEIQAVSDYVEALKK